MQGIEDCVPFNEILAPHMEPHGAVTRLANEIGVERTALYGWRNNKYPPRDEHVPAIARALKMDPDVVKASIDCSRRLRAAARATELTQLQAENQRLLERQQEMEQKDREQEEEIRRLRAQLAAANRRKPRSV